MALFWINKILAPKAAAFIGLKTAFKKRLYLLQLIWVGVEIAFFILDLGASESQSALLDEALTKKQWPFCIKRQKPDLARSNF